MADSQKHHLNLKNLMAKRFKRATGDTDELTQAAWTRAVFDQVDSLIWLVRTTSKSPTPISTVEVEAVHAEGDIGQNSDVARASDTADSQLPETSLPESRPVGDNVVEKTSRLHPGTAVMDFEPTADEMGEVSARPTEGDEQEN
jgi:hypothetical protein